MRDIFTSIYNSNGWGGRESLSGSGSDLVETESIRQGLPDLFEKWGFGSMLDIPCGDMNWMKEILPSLGVEYIGADIVPELIEANKEKYPYLDFQVLDLTKDVLPTADVILARDVLGHLSNADMLAAIENMKKSGSSCLLTTHFPSATMETDIETGKWRPVNIEKVLGEPVDFIEEDWPGKRLALWRI